MDFYVKQGSCGNWVIPLRRKSDELYQLSGETLNRALARSVRKSQETGMKKGQMRKSRVRPRKINWCYEIAFGTLSLLHSAEKWQRSELFSHYYTTWHFSILTGFNPPVRHDSGSFSDVVEDPEKRVMSHCSRIKMMRYPRSRAEEKRRMNLHALPNFLW